MRKVCVRRTSLAMQNSSISHNGLARKVRRKSFNTASILLTVSTSFVILNLPYCISFLMLFCEASGFVQWGPEALGNLFAAKYFTAVPYYLNYCINFLLYNVCARAFRVEMGRVLCYTCRTYEDKRQCRKRSPTLSRSRTTITEKLTPDHRVPRKMYNPFFVAYYDGHCCQPDTTSFTSDPICSPCRTNTKRQHRDELWQLLAKAGQ